MSKCRVLVIDDQYGRCGLGKDFANWIDPDIMAAYQADRENLCRNFGILDQSGESEPIPLHEPQCLADFCPGQRWDPEAHRIENDLESVLRAVKRGWPFSDGSCWSLILLDLAFVQGELDLFGDPQERTFFGRDTILPELINHFGSELPIVVLSSTSKSEQFDAIQRAGALDFIQRIPNSPVRPGVSRETLSATLRRHGLIPDPNGIIESSDCGVLQLLRRLRRAAIRGRPILLFGGSEQSRNCLARYIHALFGNKGPFMTLLGTETESNHIRSIEFPSSGTLLIKTIDQMDPSDLEELQSVILARPYIHPLERLSENETPVSNTSLILTIDQPSVILEDIAGNFGPFLKNIGAVAVDASPLST